MKRNAIVFGLITLLIGLTTFWSCDDNDDKDVIYQSFALVSLDQANNTFTLTTEKGNVLTPTNANVFVNKVTDGEWVIATFRDLTGAAPAYNMYLLSLDKVLTKPVWEMTVDNVDSVVVESRDPGYILKSWAVKGEDLAYVNVLFTSWWMSEPTYVNLVKNETMVQDGDTVPSTKPNPDAGVLTLDFITTYNGAQILPPQRSNGVVSFTMPLPDLANVDKIVINFTNFDGRLQQYNVTVSDKNTYVPSEFDASTPISEQVLQLE